MATHKPSVFGEAFLKPPSWVPLGGKEENSVAKIKALCQEDSVLKNSSTRQCLGARVRRGLRLTSSEGGFVTIRNGEFRFLCQCICATTVALLWKHQSTDSLGTQAGLCSRKIY